MTVNNFRIEKDALGEKSVPDAAYYGIQTIRAMENFNVSGVKCSEYKAYIKGIGVIKKAAAQANFKLGVLEDDISNAITQAADEMIQGKFDDAFIIDVFQGGGGTSTNMNANEVIANRANEILTGKKGYSRVNGNNHVNMSQSTNDVIPSAMKIAAYFELNHVVQVLEKLCDVFYEKSIIFSNVVKIGRTCIQDALPVTLGQEFGGYHSLLKRHIQKLKYVQHQCLELPLGGTAVGSGMSTMRGYHTLVFEYLNKELTISNGAMFTQESDLFDGLQNADIYIDLSSALKSLATGLSKIATDFRMLSSGPRAGFGEINLPAVQPGSSIMPGKINPVIPELINQIAYQVCGNDVAITMSVEGGELDLNVWEPVIIKNLFESMHLLGNGMQLFNEKCVAGITVNEAVCRDYAENSLALSTVISSLFDYATGSKVAKKAYEENLSIKEAVIELNLMTKEEAELYLDPLMLTDKERSGELLLERLREKK